MLFINRLLCFLFIICCSSQLAQSQKISSEMIHYIKEDGISYLGYITYRSSFSSVAISTARKTNFEKELEYINPNEYEKEKNQLNFSPGEYAYMKNSRLENVKIDSNGVYFWKKSSKPYPSGEIGICHFDGYNYSDFAYVWVLPEKFEFVNFYSNQDDKGSWVLKSNVLSFYGKDINNFVPRIKYKLKEEKPITFLNRQVEVNHHYDTDKKKLTLKIWDESKEDGDVISVSLNDEWVIKNLKTSIHPVEITLDLDRKENYLLMYAENLGKIPPNTAAIKIGKDKFRLSSDLNKCDAIKILRQ